MQRAIGWITILTAGFVFAQQKPNPEPHEMGARELYYFSASKTKEALPPITKAAAKPKPAPKDNKEAAEPVSANAVKGLGFRYSVALIGGGKITPVDSDHIFRKGDHFVLNFEANRSGYLYVLVKQSDGTWQPLLPNPEIPNDKNVVDPGQKIRVPAEMSFNIEDPPGTDTLFVVLSRDPRDIYDLNEAIKSSASPGTPPTPAKRIGEPTQMASARIGSAVDAFSKFKGTRNITFAKAPEQPQDPQETPFSKYVVSSSEQPVSKVVAQIEIQHR